MNDLGEGFGALLTLIYGVGPQAPCPFSDHISQTVNSSLTKVYDIFQLAISHHLSLFACIGESQEASGDWELSKKFRGPKKIKISNSS